MAIKNSVSKDFLSAFIDSVNVFYCPLFSVSLRNSFEYDNSQPLTELCIKFMISWPASTDMSSVEYL